MHDEQSDHPIDNQLSNPAPLEEEPGAPTCHQASRGEAACPLCQGTMRLWAGFYRCPNCGYKESCCF